MPEIVELLASPVHRFEGRPADGPAPAPEGELVGEACRSTTACCGSAR